MTQPAPALLALMTDAYGGRGGIAQYNRDFIQALGDESNLAKLVVLPRIAPDAPLTPAHVVQLKHRPGRIAYSMSAVRTAMSARWDIIYCGHLYMAPLAAFIARIKRAKLVIQTHGIEAWPRPTRLQLAAIEAADLVLSVSRYTRGAILDWAAIKPEKVIVIPNTVRDVFQPGDGTAMRKKLGLESKRVIVTVSRLDASQQYKGQDRVIAAIPFLVEQGHNVAYLVVGEGTDRPRLEGLAERVGVASRVHFLGGVDLDTLIEIYRMCDLFVMPSVGEGFGIVFLEAMASGAPALGLSVAGAADALADGRLGTVTTETLLPESIESALSSIRKDPRVLATAVRDVFGRPKFAHAVQLAIGRLHHCN